MRVLSVVLALVSAFFVFYTVRLLVVTQGLQHTRVGGQGAYVGAAVFPIIAIVFGWGAVWCWNRAGRTSTSSGRA
ncbi:MAG TPA: hypothetical protein VF929_07985 [Gemmatimonadaceae bacterium]